MQGVTHAQQNNAVETLLRNFRKAYPPPRRLSKDNAEPFLPWIANGRLLPRAFGKHLMQSSMRSVLCCLLMFSVLGCSGEEQMASPDEDLIRELQGREPEYVSYKVDAAGRVVAVHCSCAKNIDKLAPGIGSLKHLEVLDCQLSDVLDRGLTHSTRLSNLRRIVLTNTRVTGAGLASLTKLTSLRELHCNPKEEADLGLKHIRPTSKSASSRTYLFRRYGRRAASINKSD